MWKYYLFGGLVFVIILILGSRMEDPGNPDPRPASGPKVERLELSEEEWRERLSPEQYHILRERGTEAPFSSPLLEVKAPGVFVCAACELPLFGSDTKYDSKTGWPSFWQPIASHHVNYRTDYQLIYPRVEVLCARCDGHLGHVFDDGPPPTGKRWCINGLALKFVPAQP